MSDPHLTTPLWAKIVAIVAALPLLAYPWLLSVAPATGSVETFLYLYPIYVVLSTVCEWLVYPRSPEVYWIMVALMLLTHAAMFALVLL